MSESALPEVGRLLTVVEVAEHMRVSNMTVYRLIRSGHLGAIRVGRSYRIPSRELHEYLVASTTIATEVGE